MTEKNHNGFDRDIFIDIVGNRCIYINNYRVQGNKPYMSEHIPQDSRMTTVRKVLNAFTRDDIEAYLKDRYGVDRGVA